MKSRPTVFRDPFFSRRVDEDGGGLRPDMGQQIHDRRVKVGSAAGGRITPARHPSAGGTYALGRGRSVVVKARYRQHQVVARGRPQRALSAHLQYLARPDATREERAAAFFDAVAERIDAAEVPRDWARDRLHWRIILSPEDADALNLERYVREYAERLEKELGTPLEWVATVHHNTDQTHAHLVLRGIREGGGDLTLPRHVVQRRLREVAEELATRTLGERPEAEAEAHLLRLAEARRPTPLDALLADLATPAADGWRNVQVPRDWPPDLAGRRHLERRLQVLAGLGLAERTTPRLRRAVYRVRDDFAERLHQLATDAEREVSPPEQERVPPDAPAAPRRSERARESPEQGRENGLEIGDEL